MIVLLPTLLAKSITTALSWTMGLHAQGLDVQEHPTYPVLWDRFWLMQLKEVDRIGFPRLEQV